MSYPLPRFLRPALLAAAMTLAACGGTASTDAGNAPTAATQVPGSSQQVETRIGDTTVFAVAMPTTAIPAEVAREHGIERRDDLVMLRVSGRRGEAGSVSSVPLQVQATVTDLRGQPRDMTIEARPTAGLVDYVGTIDAALPDTLRFDIRVTTPEGTTQTLQLTRDIQPVSAP